jgi:hypothetical protein
VNTFCRREQRANRLRRKRAPLNAHAVAADAPDAPTPATEKSRCEEDDKLISPEENERRKHRRSNRRN